MWDKSYKMNLLKTKQILLIFSVVITALSCKAQQIQTILAKVENHLKGELDYTHEALELVQTKANGEEISLGKINTDGTIHFNLPEFNIKALYDSIPLQHYKLQDWFFMSSSCKDRDIFAETPFDDVYSKKYDPIFIKKYGIKVAVLYPVSNEEIVSRNENQRAVFPEDAKYFWLYIDRDIVYKDECTNAFSWGRDSDKIEATIGVNIQFKKGWNFIEENLVEVQNVGQGDSQTTTPKHTQFTSSSPTSKKVKWILKQIAHDGKIQIAKKLDNLTPITKEQFEKWAPNKLGDLSVTTKKYGNLPERRKNKNNIHLIYTNEAQNKEIDLYVIDFSRNPADLEMVNFSYAMENDGKDKKDIKPYIAQYSERKKATQLMYKIEDRIVVEASAVNINAEDLWGYTQKLNVEKLLKK